MERTALTPPALGSRHGRVAYAPTATIGRGRATKSFRSRHIAESTRLRRRASATIAIRRPRRAASACAHVRSAALSALAHMKSSYDKRIMLEQILARGPMSAEGKKTVLTAVPGITSDYDRRQVLTAYLKRFSVEPSVRDEFFAAVRSTASDYDCAEVLLAAAPGVDSTSRPAFVSAAERIKSSHDQNRVLAALVKAERR